MAAACNSPSEVYLVYEGHFGEGGLFMHGDRPLIGKNRLLVIRQVEALHVIIGIGSLLDRARYMASIDSPPGVTCSRATTWWSCR
jgi:hypothetical protein